MRELLDALVQTHSGGQGWRNFSELPLQRRRPCHSLKHATVVALPAHLRGGSHALPLWKDHKTLAGGVARALATSHTVIGVWCMTKFSCAANYIRMPSLCILWLVQPPYKRSKVCCRKSDFCSKVMLGCQTTAHAAVR